MNISQPFDRIMLVDAETRWDSKEYTLSKMTTEEYVRDERFKAFGFCFKEYGAGHETVWVPHGKLRRHFASIDWSRTAVMAHNAQFDVSVMTWHYGVKPAFIFDTLSMARALRGIYGRNGLAALADDFGLPPKGRAVHSTDGLIELTPEIEAELADYCKHDVFLLEAVFDRLSALAGPNGFPKKELRIINMVVRMYTDPQLELDGEMLKQALEEDETKRTTLLSKLSVDEAALQSAEQFATTLRALGVEPPMKVSKTTGKPAYAFAKNDALFQALVQHDNEDVALLCEARVMAKSTQARTRAQRFFDISQRGALPVPLHYSAAHTHRIQAARGQGLNMQNLKRGSFLRRAIMAPWGTRMIVVDLSQIEPRVLAWLAGYEEMLDIFRSGKDAYATFGARMFGIPGLTKESHPDLRQSAKSALLGCGYGLGWWAFAAQLLVGFLGAPPVRYDKRFAKQLGLRGDDVAAFMSYAPNVERALSIPRLCSDEEIIIHAVCAREIINRYREAAEPVTQLWDMCHNLIETSLYGGAVVEFKCVRFEKERIILPSGLSLRYPNLTPGVDERGRRQWTYGPDSTKLYGSKLCVDGAAEVLTDRGWVALSTVTPTDKVHDGIEFVAHGGLLFKAVQHCVTVDGVYMTPEHEVLTDEGWRPASSNPEPYRPNIRPAYCGTARRLGWQKKVVAFHLRMWAWGGQAWRGRAEGGTTRRYSQLWLRNQAATAGEERHAWAIEPPAVRCVAVDAGPLPTSYARSVEKLRRSWGSGLRAVGFFRTLLGRHVTNLPTRANTGTQERERALQPRELHVGHASSASQKPPHLVGSGHTGAGEGDRHPPLDAVLPTALRPVFDLMNCGPRKRFVVRGAGGPFIVHNCENIVQAIARCVMTDGMLRIDRLYPCVLTVHDEAVVLAPTEHAQRAEAWVLEQMVKVPSYLPGIPLAAETGVGVRYGDAKK